MRLLVDAQMPPALARWLTSLGHQAEHVADIGLLAASDLEIWEAARLAPHPRPSFPQPKKNARTRTGV
jgi:predicted nuclease of predicted toxin-antitoxin system